MSTVVVSCKFDLNPSEFADPAKVNFYIDGEIVPRDTTHINGWDFVDIMAKKWSIIRTAY